MLRLGHIGYSNCFPVHALLLDRGTPPWIRLCRGVPSELNAALAAGRVDVAPCSSIELARARGRYRVLPGLAIGSAGLVGSIRLESRVEPERLGGRTVAVPTASATSVVLLRLLLERRLGVRPRYRWFDQDAAAAGPFGEGADAALWIGDIALRRDPAAMPHRVDLGEAWTEWTGLPFAYAVWQVSAGPERDAELRELHALLHRSLDFFRAHSRDLARRHAGAFGLEPDRLHEYWTSLRYALDGPMLTGLRRFLELAAELGEPAPPPLRWIPPAGD